MGEGRVEDIYERVKEMTVGFRLRPGDRLNEGTLAAGLGVSRTPLREALNRLVSERMVDFRPGSGFYCRGLDARKIFDLYEFRAAIESAATRLACERASDEELAALERDLRGLGLDATDLTVAEACARDEAFHLEIARLSGNAVFWDQLAWANEQIRFIRWVLMTGERIERARDEHLDLMAVLVDRDADAAAEIAGQHVMRGRDEIEDAVRQAVAGIFTGAAEEISGRVVGAGGR